MLHFFYVWCKDESKWNALRSFSLGRFRLDLHGGRCWLWAILNNTQILLARFWGAVRGSNTDMLMMSSLQPEASLSTPGYFFPSGVTREARPVHKPFKTSVIHHR